MYYCLLHLYNYHPTATISLLTSTYGKVCINDHSKAARQPHLALPHY